MSIAVSTVALESQYLGGILHVLLRSLQHWAQSSTQLFARRYGLYQLLHKISRLHTTLLNAPHNPPVELMQPLPLRCVTR